MGYIFVVEKHKQDTFISKLRNEYSEKIYVTAQNTNGDYIIYNCHVNDVGKAELAAIQDSLLTA